MKIIKIATLYFVLSVGLVSYVFASPPCYPGEDCAPKVNVKRSLLRGEIYEVSVGGRFGLSYSGNVVSFNNGQYVALGGSITDAGISGNFYLISLPLYQKFKILLFVLTAVLLWAIYLVYKRIFLRR